MSTQDIFPEDHDQRFQALIRDLHRLSSALLPQMGCAIRALSITFAKSEMRIAR